MTEQDKRKPAHDEASPDQGGPAPGRDETARSQGEPVPGRDEAGPSDDNPDLVHGRPMPDSGEPVPAHDEASPDQHKPSLAGEMEKMEYEPLLPIEKKLILWSIGLGVALLVLLTWVSYSFFPAP